MATITAGDFRNGITFEMDGQVMQVVEFQHVKPGKGAAFVRTKMKNVITGAVTETSFNPTAKFESATIDRKDDGVQLQRRQPLLLHGPRDLSSMIPIDESAARQQLPLREGEHGVQGHQLLQGQGVPGRSRPTFVELEVTDTDPGFAGNTATNATKPATLETGAEIKVPLFINPGDQHPRSTPARVSICPAPSKQSTRFCTEKGA